MIDIMNAKVQSRPRRSPAAKLLLALLCFPVFLILCWQDQTMNWR